MELSAMLNLTERAGFARIGTARSINIALGEEPPGSIVYTCYHS